MSSTKTWNQPGVLKADRGICLKEGNYPVRRYAGSGPRQNTDRSLLNNLSRGKWFVLPGENPEEMRPLSSFAQLKLGYLLRWHGNVQLFESCMSFRFRLPFS